MEDTKEKSCQDCCNQCCGWCGKGLMGGKYHLLRWLLGIAIILITFWLGFKLGEFKGYYADSGFGRGYGRGMMMDYGRFGEGDYPKIRKYRNNDGQGYWQMMWQQPASTSPSN